MFPPIYYNKSVCQQCFPLHLCPVSHSSFFFVLCTWFCKQSYTCMMAGIRWLYLAVCAFRVHTTTALHVTIHKGIYHEIYFWYKFREGMIWLIQHCISDMGIAVVLRFFLALVLDTHNSLTNSICGLIVIRLKPPSQCLWVWVPLVSGHFVALFFVLSQYLGVYLTLLQYYTLQRVGMHSAYIAVRLKGPGLLVCGYLMPIF